VAAAAELAKWVEPSSKVVHLARDAGFLLWRLPERRVLIDPRTHLYGAPFYRQLAADLSGQPGIGPNLIDQIDPDVLLLNAAWSGAGPAAAHWIDTGRYALAFHDGSSALLVRPTSAFRELLEDPDLAARGDLLIARAADVYRKRLTHPWVHPGNPVRVLGAAGMYQALGRYADALPLWKLLNEGAPAYVAAWVNRGIGELALGDPEAASRSLDHAVRLAPAAFTAQCWRMRAHARAGRDDLAATLRAALYAQQPLRLLEFEKMPDPAPPAPPSR
jgi:tetratricopeptide (TPR) repeat protein